MFDGFDFDFLCFNRARTPDSPFAQYFLKEFDAELGVQFMVLLMF